MKESKSHVAPARLQGPATVDRQFHPIADAFPLLQEKEFDALFEDIRDHGLLEPIWVHRDGRIIDGRNRYRACIQANVQARYRTFEGDDSQLVRFVVSLNLKRRHLTESQRAMVAANIANLQQHERKSDASIEASGAVSQDDAAALLSVSRPSVQRAANIRHNGDASVVSAVESGELAVSAATEFVELPKGDQPKALQLAREVAGSKKITAKQAVTAREAIAARILDTDAEAARDVLEGRRTLDQVVRERKKTAKRAALEDIAVQEAKAVEGVYDVLVIDPPWPMKKIERDVAPNQVEFDYPTMNEAELAELELPMAGDCHVWLWTTHKFLPMALRLIEGWRLKYVCTFTWCKPGGFQPFGLPQYASEMALYARRGAPEFVDTKNFKTWFEAPRGAHSEKPDAFYEMVRRVTAGRRLDMFNRRAIEGFDGWGKEAV